MLRPSSKETLFFENIKDFLTPPGDSSASPNWCIIRVLHTSSQNFVAGGSEQPAHLAIMLFSHLGGDDASREAAERWLNDAEEMLCERVVNSKKTEYWHRITLPTPPRRDADYKFWGQYRTSLIPLNVEKK